MAPVSLHSRKPIYSFSWSDHVLSKVQEKYPRGYNIFLQYSKLTTQQLSFLLACNDPDWPHIRQCIRVADNWAQRQLISRQEELKWTTQLFTSLVERTMKNASSSLRGYLTRIQKELE